MIDVKGAFLKQKLHQILGDLDGMKDVEAVVRSKLESESPPLSEISNYLLDLGGKRMRPVITLLVGKACGLSTPTQPLIDVAAGIELIHMATLLHDDIIDKSPMRRHSESPFHKFGVTPTLLTGDFLLTRAFSLCARLDKFIIDATEQACIELTEGEMDETPLFEAQHTIESSLEIARKKTAALFRLGSASGSHLSNNGESVTSAMTRFGESLGIAFQILDDILDVIADETQLGKKSGMDIHERKPAIVNILWLNTETELSKRLLSAPREHEEEFVQAALKEIRGSRVIEEARSIAQSHADTALAALEQAENSMKNPDAGAFDALRLVLDYTLSRMV